MRRLLTWTAGAVAGAILTLAVAVAAQVASSGGAFLPLENYVIGANATWTWLNGTPWVIEGSTVDTNETSITFTNPTRDNTVTIQDTSGTVVLGQSTTDGAVAAGIVTLDGSNPTLVLTGLSALSGCTVQRHAPQAPGILGVSFSTQITAGAGQLDIYAWDFTSSSNPTLVASALRDTVRWVCIGTR